MAFSGEIPKEQRPRKQSGEVISWRYHLKRQTRSCKGVGFYLLRYGTLLSYGWRKYKSLPKAEKFGIFRQGYKGTTIPTTLGRSYLLEVPLKAPNPLLQRSGFFISSDRESLLSYG
ncbi:hypothetical protein [uncultured Eudoraea sp.]|uniref:hypothetical protein n=1 Tax=uncultured Eudoraea sp. TaxID=1035614 RepID=UPI00263829C9|nr:hypothetical protein [uncultured Eudoraea sp.]